MSLNLLKRYNDLLDLAGLNPINRTNSLKGIFKRDIEDNPRLQFQGKAIKPTSMDGEIPMETLFTHLTTEVVEKRIRVRKFEYHRSERLHWVKHHIDERKKDDMLVFSCKDKNGTRTYLYDKTELYVIVLEPLKNKDAYFLLTAYYLRGRNKFKIEKKFKRRLDELL